MFLLTAVLKSPEDPKRREGKELSSYNVLAQNRSCNRHVSDAGKIPKPEPWEGKELNSSVLAHNYSLLHAYGPNWEPKLCVREREIEIERERKRGKGRESFDIPNLCLIVPPCAVVLALLTSARCPLTKCFIYRVSFQSPGKPSLLVRLQLLLVLQNDNTTIREMNITLIASSKALREGHE